MAEEKLDISVVILTERSDDDAAERLMALLASGVMGMGHLMRSPVPLAAIPVAEMRRALADGEDELIEMLTQGANKCFLLATDEKAEKLLDELEVEMELQEVKHEQLVIFREIDAIVTHCERRKIKSLPETMDPLNVYAVETARLLINYLESQFKI